MNKWGQQNLGLPDRRTKKEVLLAYDESEDVANLIEDKDVWEKLK